jgi:hypothetical protein
MMAAESAAAVPAGLALSVADTVFAGTTIGGGTSATLLKIMTMTKPKLGILGAVLITGVVTSLVFQQQAEARLRAQNESLQHQTDQLAQLAADHERLSKLAKQENTPPQSGRLDELLRLRSEAALLRAQAPELARLREESRRSQQTAAPGAKTEFQIWEQVMAKQDYTQAWMRAFIAYAKANQGQLPASFEQAAPFWPKEMKQRIPVNADQFEILYHGSLDALPALDVIVLREKNLWPHIGGKWGRFYGLADGHAQYCSSSDKTANGNFDKYEREHLIPAETQ